VNTWKREGYDLCQCNRAICHHASPAAGGDAALEESTHVSSSPPKSRCHRLGEELSNAMLELQR